MLPEEIFKRRHRGTPESFSLLIVNAIFFALAGPGFIKCHYISTVFWAGLGLLAMYNFYTIRRSRESFDRVAIIAYVISLIVFAGVIVLLYNHGC